MESTIKPRFITKGQIYDKLQGFEENPRNICFILGAGASRGYVTHGHALYIPPTVREIFDMSNRAVSEVIQQPEHSFILNQRNYLISALKNNNNDLEEYLSKLYNRNDGDDTFPQLIAYLQDIFTLVSKNIDLEDNNYQQLIHCLSTLRGKQSWSFLTFNYDTLLEQSYQSTGRNRSRKFDQMSGYLRENPRILKLHGSVNFRYRYMKSPTRPIKSDKTIFAEMMDESDTKRTPIVLTPSSPTLELHTEHTEWDENKRKHVEYDVYDYPLLMIPIHGTKKHENHFFKSMLSEAKKEIEKSDLVIAIGYNFGDELFLDEIKKLDFSAKELILIGSGRLVSKPEDHLAFQNASLVWDPDNIEIFDGSSFGVFVESILTKSLLP